LLQLSHGEVGQQAAAFVFSEPAKEHHLKGLLRKQFIQRRAYFYEQLNYMHPLRESCAIDYLDDFICA
jgi:fido (protein-threonine AMPylation protein)